MKSEAPQRGTWKQNPPRDQMVSDVRALAPVARAKRLSTAFGKQNHIDDEAVVTLALDAWKTGDEAGAKTFCAELLRRVTKQVAQKHLLKRLDVLHRISIDRSRCGIGGTI